MCCGMTLRFSIEAIERTLQKHPDWRETIEASGKKTPDGKWVVLGVDDILRLDPNHPVANQWKKIGKGHQPTPLEGPGTELKKLLARIGIKPSPKCSCNAKAEHMNREGCDWCLKNIETIIGWLEAEHKAQKVNIPFIGSAAYLLIRVAIRRARKRAT